MRVLLLAPWPLRIPRHGGQLRGAAVVKAYRDSGHQVHTARRHHHGRSKRFLGAR